MMSASAGTPSLQLSANPVAVLGPQFCVQDPVVMRFEEKLFKGWKDGSFTITDGNGTLMFSIKGSASSLRDPRVLLDAAGNPIISFQRKVFSSHSQWRAFRGNSFDPNDLLFIVKKSSAFQMKTTLNVFFAGKSEDVPEFKIKGDYWQTACTIYLGNTSTIIAEMHKKDCMKSLWHGKNKYAVTVYPNVDYAFVAALMAILHEINEDQNGRFYSSYR